RLEKELPAEFNGGVGFSPDGRWLAASSGGLRLWAVDGSKPGPEIGGAPFAFSQDGKLLAVGTGDGAVRLLDPESGREYARREVSNLSRATPLTFTPDGGRLVIANRDSGSIKVWDLRAIRAELAKVGLDWDLPPYPPAENRPRHALEVQVDLGPSESPAQ